MVVGVLAAALLLVAADTGIHVIQVASSNGDSSGRFTVRVSEG